MPNICCDDSLDTTFPAPENQAPYSPTDPIKRLPDVLVGIKKKPLAQTFMVRPVSTTLTFDGKWEKNELFEVFFYLPW